jgi:superfamily II DNA/RNA helicase
MEERVRVQEEFEKGVTKVLICTDLMTRGIDVPGATDSGRGGGKGV